MLKDRILIVDDDPSWQELLAETIEGLGPCTLRVAGSYAEADALLDRQHFHLAFVDLRLREEARELEGKKLARKLAEQDEGTAIVIATGHADVQTAITALREWRVLDFILKDEWNPDKVVRLAQAGLPAARTAYRQRYESAADLLRGGEELTAWLARILAVVAPASPAPRPDRRLSDLLNGLLAGFYPLLPERAAQGLALDADAGCARGRFWSKALGGPIGLCFGRPAAVRAAAAAASAGFATVARSLADAALGAEGIVTMPAAPVFEAFA
jgi:ActR/RegA family two-component response regulator